VFNPLDRKVLKSITILQLDEFAARILPLGITLSYDMKVVNHIVSETYNPEFGARPVRRYIQEMIEDKIADAMVDKKSKNTLALSLEKKTISFLWK
jgi:ATP-dependent Clp protease ATP-binding subunit ClpA